jgi:riboflavin kinase/FMN adenylyltransferase
VDQTVVLPFRCPHWQRAHHQEFISDVLVGNGLGARYVLVGDDFRFGANAPATMPAGPGWRTAHGFDVARMNSYEVHGLRVSSSAVRAALA